MTADQLRDVFQRLDAARAQEIREFYFDAVAGLQNLVTALEVADSECGSPDINLLLDEHLVACEALQVMGKSQLGAVV